ncbi:MAG: LysM peptidoglycan-binding domain-containing protein [Anaerolineae bacterium]|nr:LysM peptidoglycan-binding domain-containing protein [Anaerolineae bacterium]
MMRFLKLMMFAAALFTLAGCYRPAGDALPPTDVEPLVTPQPSDSTQDAGNLAATSDVQAASTATLPPITIIAPQSPQPRPTLSLGTSAEELTQTATVAPAQSSLTETPQFITPGGPGLVTIVVPTGTPINTTSTATPSGLITPTALGTGADECTYVVQAGEGLFRIALNNGFTLEEMREANPELVGENPILQPGQILHLPNCEAATVPDTEPTQAQVVEPPANTGTTTYVVQTGDTLFSIAQTFGITVQDIINANSLANPDRLDVGQSLIIPQAGP